MPGRVEHIFVCLRHRLPMKPVEQAEAILDQGLKGCAHGRVGSRRQVLLMDSKTLEGFGISPGAAKENLSIRGLDLRGLEAGQRLQAGEAQLEVTLPCEPCGRMDDIRQGLQVELRGRRGMLCRVVGGGIIRRGDAIELCPLGVAEPTAAERSGVERTE